MKLLLCATCGDMRALRKGSMQGFQQVIPRPVVCDCGSSWAEWTDPTSGIARYGGRRQDHVFGIGLHNGLLRPPLEELKPPQAIHYKLHTFAHGYVFKDLESMIAIFIPGSTRDTSFDADWTLEESAA